MGRVIGIGGVFVKSDHPKDLAAWYKTVLGVEIKSWGGAKFEHPKLGCTVWSAFPADSDYLDPSPHVIMVNLIVDDLDGVLARAAEAGVQPLKRSDDEGQGRFAWVMDPAGVKLELWEPKADA